MTRSAELQRKPAVNAAPTRAEAAVSRPGARVAQLESMQAMLDRRSQSPDSDQARAPVQRRISVHRSGGPAAAVGSGPGVVQRVITLTKENVSETPDEVFQRIKNSRDGRKFIDKWGEQGLLQWLQARDGRTYASSNALQSELKKTLNNDPSGGSDTKFAYVNSIRTKIGNAADIVLGDSRPADELYYKLALASKLPNSDDYVTPFLGRLAQLAKAIALGQPVDVLGVRSTLRLLTTTWSGAPTDYLGGKFKESLVGKNDDGVPVSIMGLNSELDAILNVDPSDLAKGEFVFSGSNYTDPDAPEQTKDVDVSYIDRNETLHLIESAKDMNTLYNKVVGKHDQKSIYSHLTNRATSLQHTSVGPLTEMQAQRDSIGEVQWWYSVPPETLELNVSDPDIRSTIGALVSAGAGLRSGNRRYTPEQLAELLN